MDPATAFSLVAGILAIVDISFKAIAHCRELLRDGSLAEHKYTSDITAALGIPPIILLCC